MEKASSGEINLDEWEILHDDGFLGFHQSDGKGFLAFDSRFRVDMDYFICPPPPTRHHLQTTDDSMATQSGRKKLVPVLVRLEPMVEKNPDGKLVKDIGEVPVVEISVAEQVGLEKMKDPNWVPDQDTISQVFFRKMKEKEFVDMKMDSPRSSCRGLKPQIELGAIQFKQEEEEEEGCKVEDLEEKPEELEIEKESFVGPKMEEKRRWVGGGLSIWRWKVTGIGALCSMGVAAAAISIFIFGSLSHQRQKQRHQNQKIRFQIYADDQTLKHVVDHATRLKQRVPMARAHITFGGYYEGL